MKSYKHLDLSKSFAQLSLPECLEIMDGAPGWKVVAKTGLKKFSQFGPLQGEKFSGIDIPDESEMTNLWPVRNTNVSITLKKAKENAVQAFA